MAYKKTLLVIPCFMKSRRRYKTTEGTEKFSVVSKNCSSSKSLKNTMNSEYRSQNKEN